MNRSTYEKIQRNADYLRRIHADGKLENSELFDEPFKLALKILDCGNLDDRKCAQELGINLETVKQVRSALGI